MPKQNDGIEKLVEEMRREYLQEFQYTNFPFTEEQLRHVHEQWRWIITRILKAVMDGMSLPREEGRGRLHAHGIYEDVDWDDGRHGKVRNEDHRFIALSPLGIPVERKEGTFLEEEAPHSRFTLIPLLARRGRKRT